MPCKAYHAALKPSERTEVQDDWMEGRVPVIAATVSFGMGVDKANVRFVLAHADLLECLTGLIMVVENMFIGAVACLSVVFKY